MSIPNLMVNDIVAPTRLPRIISVPTGDVMVPEKVPLEGFSVGMCKVSP